MEEREIKLTVLEIVLLFLIWTVAMLAIGTTIGLLNSQNKYHIEHWHSDGGYAAGFIPQNDIPVNQKKGLKK